MNLTGVWLGRARKLKWIDGYWILNQVRREVRMREKTTLQWEKGKEWSQNIRLIYLRKQACRIGSHQLQDKNLKVWKWRRC